MSKRDQIHYCDAVEVAGILRPATLLIYCGRGRSWEDDEFRRLVKLCSMDEGTRYASFEDPEEGWGPGDLLVNAISEFLFAPLRPLGVINTPLPTVGIWQQRG